MVLVILFLAGFLASSIADWIVLTLLDYKGDQKLSLCFVQTISLSICVLKCSSLIIKKIIAIKGYLRGFLYAPIVLYKIVLLIPLVNYECLSMICKKRRRTHRISIQKATENATEQMINTYAY